MRTITREELKQKLDRGDDFRLVMALGVQAFRAGHIPGSIHFNSLGEALNTLKSDEEVVVYCSDPTCIASQAAYHFLERKGYTNVQRYSGGLADWDAAGYPLQREGVGT